jgi:hypothetical protein
METAEKNADLAFRHSRHGFSESTNSLKLGRRHDEEELSVRFRDHDEVFAGAVFSPARRNGDAFFVVDLMTKLAGVKNRISRDRGHAQEKWTISIHFPPL